MRAQVLKVRLWPAETGTLCPPEEESVPLLRTGYTELTPKEFSQMWDDLESDGVGCSMDAEFAQIHLICRCPRSGQGEIVLKGSIEFADVCGGESLSDVKLRFQPQYNSAAVAIGFLKR